MNEFDKLMFAERLVELYRERGKEMTAESVLHRAKKIARNHGWELEDALETMEETLLSRNPEAGKYDVD